MSQERSKGRFLTDKQREYLHGNHEPPTDNAESAMQSKIRSRIEGALFELKVINSVIDDDTLKPLFEDWTRLPESTPDDSQRQSKMPQQMAEIQAVIRMAYRGYRLNGMDADEFVNSIVENAIRQAEAERNDVHANKNISIDLELNNLEVHTDYDELSPVEKFDKGLPLTWDEQMQLYDEISDKLDRDISVDEAGELIEKHLIESSNQSEN